MTYGEVGNKGLYKVTVEMIIKPKLVTNKNPPLNSSRRV